MRRLRPPSARNIKESHIICRTNYKTRRRPTADDRLRVFVLQRCGLPLACVHRTAFHKRATHAHKTRAHGTRTPAATPMMNRATCMPVMGGGQQQLLMASLPLALPPTLLPTQKGCMLSVYITQAIKTAFADINSHKLRTRVLYSDCPLQRVCVWPIAVKFVCPGGPQKQPTAAAVHTHTEKPPVVNSKLYIEVCSAQSA